ncbi:hypothetical protein C8J56DRAFT_307354 [Mycena floridula]|nr:hypothetical protein C8J56DRAFT_307354 [Mycena floridula]
MADVSSSSQTSRPPRNRRNKPKRPAQETEDPEKPVEPKVGQSRRRGRKFEAGLTAGTSNSNASKERLRKKQDFEGNDLVSNLIRNLSVSPYAECVVCFNPIHPAQPTWSCSPTIPITVATDSSSVEPQYCWTTFHLKCIQSWSQKSFKDMQDAWRARGESHRGGEWRCPGCQGKRTALIGGYRCFCGSTPSPQSRLGTPHSCGSPCSRARTSCGHPCPLMCHPGPCPPCKITREVACSCPRARKITVRCSEDDNVSCGEICSSPLGCRISDHLCQEKCHQGPCEPCDQREQRRCWCGKVEREDRCGELRQIWEGKIGCGEELLNSDKLLEGFTCGATCEKAYDCMNHNCQKFCHPTLKTPTSCPFSPDKVQRCPCGKRPIASSTDIPGSDNLLPARSSCLEPIPTCHSPCSKPLEFCDHPCQFPCHTGPCPPCDVDIARPCRCGSATQVIKCGKFNHLEDSSEILCDKPCPALRDCGRHRCNRVCCPLASFAASKGKGKRRALLDPGDQTHPGGWHECDIVCGKALTCGNHHCAQRDHRGPCPPCLQSSFEELICPCGRTILEPPVPCGTIIQCNYPCSNRTPPSCGHPRTPHSCHALTSPCPPCPFLATKQCACGKKLVDNVKCSLERDKLGCGTACGKLLDCGFHRCEKLCHAGSCGECNSPCGKSRKQCLPNHHPCTLPCHAPSACAEDIPCQSLVSLSCPCGRINQSVHCHQQRVVHQPKCTSECAIAQRNAKLASALGINPIPGTGPRVTYAEDLVKFGRANARILALAETTLNNFVLSSTKKSQVLPQMNAEQRKFVNELASVYRLDTQMVDQEPHRSVQILRRIDTRVPAPLLSAHIASLGSTPNLGKLGDLRGGSGANSWRTPSAVKSAPAANRGWPLAARATVNEPTIAPTAPRPVTPNQSDILPRRIVAPGPIINTVPTNASVQEPPPDNWEDDE